ncbi:DUF6624 domain-containing protein [uncultured Pseudoteredinibacter sp.]|uniref:DUF6624 domain-containing protein n=1 Tax=uncultured Pseudoteredinibacter sp. TaxID=1641701 RepID=UPI0026107856|nr:DUF6624 domain-containing protein [uncultured Pseudoteredinibacter sp.]
MKLINVILIIFTVSSQPVRSNSETLPEYQPILEYVEKVGQSEALNLLSGQCPRQDLGSNADLLGRSPDDSCLYDSDKTWLWVVLRTFGQNSSRPAAIESLVNINEVFNLYKADFHAEFPSVDPSLKDLPKLHGRDQFWDRVAVGREKTKHRNRLNDADLFTFGNLVQMEKYKIYVQNQRILEKLVSIHGWPKWSVYGKKVSLTAWLITQHSDHNVAFQKKALSLMKPLAQSGETSKSDYAYLYDRVLTNTEGKTLYGTQLVCVNGKYQPRNVIDPEGLAERRKEYELGPIEEYLQSTLEFSGGRCG